MASTLLPQKDTTISEQPTALTIALAPEQVGASRTSLLIQEYESALPLALAAQITQETVKPRSSFGFRAQFSRFFNQEFRAKAKKILPWFLSGTILAANVMIHAPIAVLGAGLVALSIQVIRAIICSNPLCQKLWKAMLAKANMEEKDVPWIEVSTIGFGSWLAAAVPSLAFLETAETLVTGLFAQAGGAAGADVTPLVPLLFGVIRVVFIIYVLVALVRVIVAFRNDEDWSTAARIPLIVVLCVVLGDALSTLIAKGSKGAGG